MQATRRAMLKLIAAAPFLAPAFQDAFAAESTVKKRIVLFMFHTGYASEYWFPQGAARAAMDLSATSLKSLAPVKDKISILKNVQNHVGIASSFDGHWSGPASAYSAQILTAASNSIKGVSLDQHIANKTAFGTSRKSLALAVGGNPNSQPVFYKAKASPATILNNPYDAITNVFGSFMGGNGASDPVTDLQSQKSMLDAIRGDLSRLSGRLVGAEKAKLDAHLSLVRDSELNLGKNLNQAASTQCKKLDTPSSKIAGVYSATNFPALARIQMDLIAMAMACDISRIFCFQALNAYPNEVMSWDGVAVDDKPVSAADGAQGLHRLAHSRQGTADRVLFGNANAHYASAFAYLLQKLNLIPDGTGTLLDNSIAMMNSDYGDDDSHDGTNHSWGNLPIIVGGRGGGFFKSGQVLECGERSHTQVLGAMMAYFGINRTAAASNPGDGDFGDAGFSYEPLPGLLA
jgi:Protein of unknown function (DUF1552)